MKKFIKMLPVTIALAFVLQMGLIIAPSSMQPTQNGAIVSADSHDAAKNSVCEGVGLVGGSGCGSSTDAQGTVGSVLETAINLFSMIVGVISVIMIIVGGLKYITSMGDGGNVKSAKDTILYAIIGLVIVVMAQVIVRFVLTSI